MLDGDMYYYYYYYIIKAISNAQVPLQKAANAKGRETKSDIRNAVGKLFHTAKLLSP